eukprot:8510988-Pyramimonas_sp.AAC.1
MSSHGLMRKREKEREREIGKEAEREMLGRIESAVGGFPRPWSAPRVAAFSSRTWPWFGAFHNIAFRLRCTP